MREPIHSGVLASIVPDTGASGIRDVSESVILGHLVGEKSMVGIDRR